MNFESSGIKPSLSSFLITSPTLCPPLLPRWPESGIRNPGASCLLCPSSEPHSPRSPCRQAAESHVQPGLPCAREHTWLAFPTGPERAVSLPSSVCTPASFSPGKNLDPLRGSVFDKCHLNQGREPHSILTERIPCT